MTQLYPPIQPFDQQFIDTGDGHRLYLQQTGNLSGIPVLYLHGGPGAGIALISSRLFDPQKYRIITFDQRGCGQSTPFCGLDNNTTEHQLQDIEQIRQHLKIDEWVVCGGSWGSTLSLLYAIAYPQRVKAMILRGIFLARQQDYDWFLTPEGGAAQLFPDRYQDFLHPVREHLTDKTLLDAYFELMTAGNELSQSAAARAWSHWEASIATLQQSTGNAGEHELHTERSLSLLECHYIRNSCFIKENHIIDNIDRIAHIPGTIIHGRYDMVCKLEGAYKLAEQWHNGELMVVPAAGHSGTEPAIAQAFCQASDALLRFLNEEQES